MVTLAQVDVEDPRLGRLLQLYLHDWSAVVAVPMHDDALFAYEELPLYRDQDARAAFLFVDQNNRSPLGFALAMRDPTQRWQVEEFFVIASARRRGVGVAAAAALFAARPGCWTLTVRQENPAALAFWRRAAPGAHERVEVAADGVSRTRLSFVA